MLLFHESSKTTQHMWFWQEGWTVGPLSPPFNWLHNNVSRMESLETIQIQDTENPLFSWWLFSEQTLQDTLNYHRSLKYHMPFDLNYSSVSQLQLRGLVPSSLVLKALPQPLPPTCVEDDRIMNSTDLKTTHFKFYLKTYP